MTHKNDFNSTHTFTAGVANQNINAILENDITISGEWTPIGVYSNTNAKPYLGTFDGNQHTVTFNSSVNITGQSIGLFAMIGSDCKIENLVIDGSINSSDSAPLYGGGIVGYSEGGSINYCVNKATVNCTTAGGIVGQVKSSSSISICGCVNLGNITGTNYGAGIVGYSDGSILQCINTGAIISSSGTACGISGGISSSCTVQQCINLGTLSASTYLYGITSGSINIDNNISAGKFEGSVSYTMYAVSYNCTDKNYYDNTIGSGNNFSPSYATSKATTELFSVFLTDDLSWSFAENRYPLPDLENSLPTGSDASGQTIWDQIVDAATPNI